MFSPWLAWKGGKGVASMLGVFLALAPLAAALRRGRGLAAGLRRVFTHLVGVGSLVAALTLVISMLIRHEPNGYLAVVVATFVLVVVRHIENIKRLLEKKEGRV